MGATTLKSSIPPMVRIKNTPSSKFANDMIRYEYLNSIAVSLQSPVLATNYLECKEDNF